MCGKPNIVVSEILIDIDEYQDPWKEDAQQQISPLRNRIGRICLREHQETEQQHDPGKEERKEKKVKIHFVASVSDNTAARLQNPFPALPASDCKRRAVSGE